MERSPARGALLRAGARAARGLAGLVAALTAAGCGGAAFSEAADAGPAPGVDGATQDAPAADGPAGDGEGPRDAAADGPGTWCSTQTSHFFCDDFDTLPLPSNFTKVNTSGNGTLSYDSVVVRTAPHALLAATPLAAAINTSALAMLTKPFLTRDGSHVVAQADLQIASQCTVGADTVSPIGFFFADYALALFATAAQNGSPGAEMVELSLAPDGGVTAESQHTFRTALPLDQWFTIVIDAQLGSAQTVDVTVAGKAALIAEKLNLDPMTAPQHPTLLVGASTNSGPGVATAGCTVRVDNVLLDIRLL